MTTTIFITLISSLLHAFWNFRSRNSSADLFHYLRCSFIGILLFGIPAFLYRNSFSLFNIETFAITALSGVFQTIYFRGLTGVYKKGELSAAYPLFRAVPVILILFLSNLLEGRALSTLTVFGIVITATGSFLIPLPLKNSPAGWKRWAVLTALGTTGYTLAGSRAISLLRTSYEATGIGTEAGFLFQFVFLETLFTLLFLFGLLSADNKRTLKPLPDLHSAFSKLLQSLPSAVAMHLTWFLILTAISLSGNPAIVSAFRQSGIVFAAVLGFVLLKEKIGRWKIIGLFFITSGLIICMVEKILNKG